ncbi:hypothetical protein I230019B6_18250 [Firmicutes bacterium i23-0019-B6]
MLNYETFKIELQKELDERNIETEEKVISKNNAVKKERIMCKCKGKNMFPLIDLKELFELYEQKGMQSCMVYIQKSFEAENEIPSKTQYETWEHAKQYIRPEVIHAEWNSEFLKDMPHLKYLNLAIIFRFIIAESEEGMASTVITNQFLKHWDIQLNDLLEEGMKNLYKQKFTIESIYKKIGLPETEIENAGIEMYVMSNTTYQRGAVAIMRPDLLSAFAEGIKSDLYIIPSSVHELILLPLDESADTSAMKEMIRETNQLKVDQEEWLSDSLYCFRRESGEVEIAVA